MTIPEGAVAKGCKEEMFLAILREDKDRLKLAGIMIIGQPQKLLAPQHTDLCCVYIVSFDWYMYCS